MYPRPVPTARVGLLAIAALCLLCLVVAIGCGKSTPKQAEASAASEPGVSAGPEKTADRDVPVKEWDQERMTQLTADLSKAMRAVRNTFRNDPILRSPDSMMQRSANQMMTTLRQLDQTCSSLASEVAKGRTADETRDTARRIGMLLRDANNLGRSIMTTEWTDAKIKPAMELINEIAPYYGHGPLYDVDEMKMLDAGPNPNRRQQGQ
jgi:hypothetical protein